MALNDKYRNEPKFLDRYAWANSADPDQRSSLIRVYTVCHSVCMVWTHYSMVEPHTCSSNFRVITTKFLGVRIFRKFMVLSCTEVYIIYTSELNQIMTCEAADLIVNFLNIRIPKKFNFKTVQGIFMKLHTNINQH